MELLDGTGGILISNHRLVIDMVEITKQEHHQQVLLTQLQHQYKSQPHLLIVIKMELDLTLLKEAMTQMSMISLTTMSTLRMLG